MGLKNIAARASHRFMLRIGVQNLQLIIFSIILELRSV